MRLVYGVLAIAFIWPGRLCTGAVGHSRRKAPVREQKAYDTSVRGFSPDGSIYQVEYAVKAAESGGLTIGVQTDQGLVLAAQGRRRSPLLKNASVSKIIDVDARMYCAVSGLLPDGRLLVDCARSWVQNHRFEYDEAPSVEAVTSELSRLALKFNGYDENDDGPAMSRPVGVALLMAGIDRGDRPVLYHLDPSGAYVQWRARAIGEKGAAAEAKLEKAGPYGGMTVRRAMAVVLRVFKDVLGDDFSVDRLEMVCVDMCGRDGEQGESTPGAEEYRRGTLQSLGKACDPSAGLTDGDSGDAISRQDSSCGAREGGGPASEDEGARGTTSSRLLRNVLFRRVPKGEMEALLSAEEPGGADVHAD